MDIVTSRADYFSRVSRGKIPGAQTLTLAGYNPDLDAGTLPETLWAEGGSYAWQTAAESLELVSDSASDTAAGTGARTVIVVGLSLLGAALVEAVTMNGLTPVPLSNQMYRVNSAMVDTAGSSGTNVGSLTLRVAGGGAVRRRILPDVGRAEALVYTVPAGRTLVLMETLGGVLRGNGATGLVEVKTRVRLPGKAWQDRLAYSVPAAGGNTFFSIRTGSAIPEMSDIETRATSTDGFSNIGMRATMTFLSFDNTM